MRIQEVSSEYYYLSAQCEIIDPRWKHVSDCGHSHQLHVVKILIDLNVKLWNTFNLRCSLNNQTYLNFSLFELAINFRHFTCDFIESV